MKKTEGIYPFRYGQHRTRSWWSKFRAMCLERDISIVQLLCDLIDEWMKYEKEKEYQR